MEEGCEGEQAKKKKKKERKPEKPGRDKEGGSFGGQEGIQTELKNQSDSTTNNEWII